MCGLYRLLSQGIVAITTASLLSVAHADDRPALVRADTTQGTVEGESLGSVLAFRGIPYAAPPEGRGRFHAPVSAPSWAGVRSALDFGPACPQLIDDDPTENNDSVMAEDCLTLNVWTPKADNAKRPVMVWIHGGAFVVGSSRNSWYDGSHLAARGDVVVVTINYRLGAWGFLSLSSFGPEYAESANLGLLDQVMALRWVRDNIERFGGDPQNVTIFGESAGAASVGALLSMPIAKGLISKAILQSGLPSDRPPEAFARQNQLAREFLKIAGVREPTQLAAKSMKDLLAAQDRLFASKSDIGTFVPTIDGVVLKERPFSVVAEGRGAPVPLLIGTTQEEMQYFATAEDLGIREKPRPLMLSQLRKVAGPRAEEILAEYERLYPVWGDAVVQIASDAVLRLPSIRLAEAVSAFRPIYMYLFTYRSNSTYKRFGSAHAMELPFVFGVMNAQETVVFTGRDPGRYELAARMMDTWAAFARTGNPSLTIGPAWPNYDPVSRNTMELGLQSHVVSDPLSSQRKIWRGDYPSVEGAWRFLQENR